MNTDPATLMDLRESIEYIRDHEKELRLFNLDQTDAIQEDLRRYLGTLNVRITAGQTSSGAPASVAVLSNATEVLAVVGVATLRELLEDTPTGAGQLGIADGKYEQILGYLKETTFTSYETERLVYSSREIEDRARRVGRGSIHAGFQQCSVITEQRPVYRDLARRGVSVHAYGVPDAPPPDLGSGQIHPVSTEEIAETWFVVFDGGGDESQKTALLAHERDEGSFYGSWTYDPGFVDRVLDYLNYTYNTAPDGTIPDG